MALGRRSRRCNNFGSYVWFNRRGERVDFMPWFATLGIEFNHWRCLSLPLAQLPSVGSATSCAVVNTWGPASAVQVVRFSHVRLREPVPGRTTACTLPDINSGNS